MNQIKEFLFHHSGSKNGLFGELTVAYRTGSRELIQRIVEKIKAACEKGFDIVIPSHIDDDEAEDYAGNQPEMLAAKYIVTLYRSKYGQDEYECQEYLQTGLLN